MICSAWAQAQHRSRLACWACLQLLQIGTHESFQVVVDERNVGYVSLTNATSCIRTLSTVRGGLVS